MALYLCLCCGNIYDNKYVKLIKDRENNYFCPTFECNGEPFEVDENMIEPIKILFYKGYYTKNCCSGHMYGRNNPYIQFTDNRLPLTCPDKWYIDKSSNCIRYDLESEEFTKDRILELSMCNYSLYNWCEELTPNIFIDELAFKEDIITNYRDKYKCIEE